MMQAQAWVLPDTSQDAPQTLKDMYSMPSTSGFKLQDLRSHLPPWLGGRAPVTETRTLLPMLRALIAATEAYMESKVEDAVIVFPARPPRTLFEALEQAGHDLALDLPSRFQSPAGHLAAYANGIGREDWNSTWCSEPRLFLSLDYSRAGLSAVLSTDECGVFESVRAFHDDTLGTNTWNEHTGDSLRSALRNITTFPVEMPEVTYNRIDAVVLAGEKGEDPRLRAALKDVLSSSVYHSTQSAQAADEKVVEPLFAAAFGAAILSLEQKDWESPTPQLELK